MLALVLLGKGDTGRTIPQRFVNVAPQAERIIALLKTGSTSPASP